MLVYRNCLVAVVRLLPIKEQMLFDKTAFTAPKEPGEYPYVCTFPGHWRLMKGVMTVE